MEQYLLLAKGTKGRALVDLIQKVTAEPGIFAFAELLDLSNIQEVGHTVLWIIVTIFGMPCRASIWLINWAYASGQAPCREQHVSNGYYSHILSLQLCLLQLAKSEHAQAYHLLNVFAYGTLAEYNGKSATRMSSCMKSCSSRISRNCQGCRRLTDSPHFAASRASLPAISEQQQLKLRQLTAISIAEDKKVRWMHQPLPCPCSAVTLT